MDRIILKYISYQIIFLLLAVTGVFSQDHVAKIMIIPSDSFCLANGCTITDKVDSDGVIKANIGKVIMENKEFVAILGKLNALFAVSGFEIDNIQNELKKMSGESILTKLKVHDMENAIQETPLELLLRTANNDFVLPLSFSYLELNGENSLSVELKCKDAYSDELVASIYKSGSFSSDREIPEMVELLITESLPDFISTINEYYDQLYVIGREVKLTLLMAYPKVGVFDKQYTYKGEEQRLDSVVMDWVKEHSKNGDYSVDINNNTIISFSNIRLPMTFERNGRVRNMNSWIFVNSLRKFLKSEPFTIESKAYFFGLGEAWLEIK